MIYIWTQIWTLFTRPQRGGECVRERVSERESVFRNGPLSDGARGRTLSIAMVLSVRLPD